MTNQVKYPECEKLASVSNLCALIEKGKNESKKSKKPACW
jgi:hypothetical protein